MGLADVLLGRKKLKSPAEDRLFALSTARVTLDAELGLKTAGAGGIVFKPLSAGEFVGAENGLQHLPDAVAGESAAGPVLEPDAALRTRCARNCNKSAISRSPSARPARPSRPPSSAALAPGRPARRRPSAPTRGRAASGRR